MDRLISDTYAQQLSEYIDGVLSGRLIVSRSVHCSVQRHVSDMAKQSTATFPYHFSPSLAAKTCRFFPGVLRHSIGRYAGMPFELSDFQVFCKSMIFGWLRDCDDTRRFRKTYRSYARKNGKSTDIAGESIYMAGFDRNPIRGIMEPVAQVVMAATKRDQVDKILFAEAKRMREKSPSIAKRSKFVRKEIRFYGNDGEIITTGSDKPYDGLNPHCVNLDELHAWKEHHREFYDTMMTGSGFRDQPLINVITTAGDDKSHLWKEVYTYAKAVVAGEIQDETYFAFIAELDEYDDPFDEQMWVKANPNIGVSISLDYLRQQATEAKASKINTNRFTRYHGNRIVTSIEQAFDMDEWDACKGELSDWSEADCVCAGFDLGGYDDLSSPAMCARFLLDDTGDKPVHRYEVRSRAFISDKTLRDLTKQPFYDWIYKGLLTVSRHPTADLRESIIEDSETYSVQKVAFDPSNARGTSEELSQAGLIAASMGQNCTNFNEPIHDLMAAIREGRFTHDGNPLLRWCVSNAVLIRDRQDRWMFDKRDSSDKIDAAVAMTMAFRLATLEPVRSKGRLYL